MSHAISIVHRLSAESFGSCPESNYLLWKTCVRQIAIGHSGEWSKHIARSTDQVFHGTAAYQFLLEVICGLHSPVIGETEVLGQFKLLIKNIEYHYLPFGQELKNFFSELLTDAKTVRENFLSHLGAQSYGSLVRKYTKQKKAVHFVGSGILVEEILPWLMKEKASVTVYVRTAERIPELKNKFPFVDFVNLQDLRSKSLTADESVVIAAPVAANDVIQWLKASSPKLQILDLRGESAIDPLPRERFATVSLGEIFGELSSVREQALQKLNSAKDAIGQMAQKKSSQIRMRPFGWDDLCA